MISLPSAFTERIRSQLGTEADAFLEALDTPSPVSIRLNPRKKGTQPVLSGFVDGPVPWCSNGFYLKERPVFTLDPAFHGGAYYVQEASSMFLEHILHHLLPDHPVRMLDLCAAPGGKSTLAASLLPPGSLLVANEVIKSRTGILKENILRWGHANILVTQNDASAFAPFSGAFDFLLIDAPCSGEGMFRKDAGAIAEWSESHLQICSDRQKRIVAESWEALKPGGYLIYSTCTYNPGENEHIGEWICRNLAAESIPVPHPFPEITPAPSTVYGYHFYPHKTRGEGFFISVFRKTDGPGFYDKPPRKSPSPPSGFIPPEIERMLGPRSDLRIENEANKIYLLPLDQAEFVRQLEKRLHVLYKGCEVAEIYHRKPKFLHPFALYYGLQPAYEFDTDRETALRFLKKEDISVTTPPGEWVLISYNHIGLGWGKNLGSRLNNYFPKEWRIRMDIS